MEPIEPDPVHDEKYVTVEFDDGDSGSIILDDIRLLQPNYPLVGKYLIYMHISSRCSVHCKYSNHIY